MARVTSFCSRVRFFVIAMGSILLLSLSAAAQLSIVPTTTLTAETANNTSASSAFKAQTNGNAGAGNVSKLPLRNLLYPGSTTKIYAGLMPWFGRSDHMSVGYNSPDPTEIHAQVDDMLSRGIDGVIIDWYGPNRAINSATAANYMTEANSRGGAFEFSLMEDVGALLTYASQNGCDVTQQLITDLTYMANTFFISPAYTKVNSRPVVYFFGVDAYYIDWNKVRASVPGNPLLLKRNPDGFSATQSDGAYSWVEINTSDPNDMMLSYLDTFFTTASQNPTKYTVGSTYKGFNDTLAGWGSNRIVNQQCGRTWLATFAELNNYYSSSHQLPAVQLVTWNDYEEATEMETGIDNCVDLTATVSGSSLTWDIGAAATDSTIDHYRVFISTDGQALMKLADVPAGTHSLDLSQYNLAAGNYVLYVQAVGQPSIVNHMSPAVGFNPTDQPPVASLSVSPASGVAPLAVTASAAGSSDPDGSIALSQIDFGDGTTASGLTATHTYSAAGKYTVTLTVTDNAGVFASTQATVTVAAGPGVTITSPGAGATVNSPVHVTATATMTGGVSYMEALIDGAIVYSTAGSSVNTYLKVAAGSHELRVAAHDPTGAYITAQETIYVSTSDAPPTAVLNVSLFGGTSNKVMACTSTSSDSDGWVTSSAVDFGDGAKVSGPTAFHTYSSPGTYTVTATVKDNAGVTSLTSSQVTIPGSSVVPQPDFTLALSSSSAAVKPGQAASLTASVDSLGSFSAAVTFSCTGLPAGAACSFSPVQVSPAANGQAATTVTITTEAQTMAGLLPFRNLGTLLAVMAPLFAIALAGSAGWSRRNKIVVLVVIGGALIALQGCGSAQTPAPRVSAIQGTPAGTYTVTISATSSGAPSITHSQTVTLNVQ